MKSLLEGTHAWFAYKMLADKSMWVPSSQSLTGRPHDHLAPSLPPTKLSEQTLGSQDNGSQCMPPQPPLDYTLFPIWQKVQDGQALLAASRRWVSVIHQGAKN